MRGDAVSLAPPPARNRQFDLMRILFAVLVLLSHAPEITDGNRSREILDRLTDGALSFGNFAVDGFFLLSGFLIMQSWQRDPEFWSFLQKRFLRIVPGYAVAVCLSVLVVGLLAPAVPHFFHRPSFYALKSVLMLSAPTTAPVFPGQSYPTANGSLWTIPYEFRCYLLIAALGVSGLLRHAAAWVVLTLVLITLCSSPALAAHLQWHRGELLIGTATEDFRLTAFFCVGGCFYLLRRYIAFRPSLALLMLAALGVLRIVAVRHIESGFLLLGSYLMFYVAQHRFRALSSLQRFPDVSYGLYLYGWPVEALLIFLLHPSPWVTFAISAMLCALLGLLSWHFVERPMLTLKRHATAPLPAP